MGATATLTTAVLPGGGIDFLPPNSCVRRNSGTVTLSLRSPWSLVSEKKFGPTGGHEAGPGGPMVVVERGPWSCVLGPKSPIASREHWSGFAGHPISTKVLSKSPNANLTLPAAPRAERQDHQSEQRAAEDRRRRDAEAARPLGVARAVVHRVVEDHAELERRAPLAEVPADVLRADPPEL